MQHTLANKILGMDSRQDFSTISLNAALYKSCQETHSNRIRNRKKREMASESQRKKNRKKGGQEVTRVTPLIDTHGSLPGNPPSNT